MIGRRYPIFISMLQVRMLPRSLAARRIGVLDMEDIKSIQAHVNAFMAKLDKSNPRNILRKQIMEQFGFDIDNLPDDIVNNPGLLDEVLPPDDLREQGILTSFMSSGSMES